ncbi:hypothetical protein HYPSUDRAFT_137230 [Hypholoma sublateritium FD-334 SS-4]|uniref:MICOS complex subunit MIC12 n=1 Tax=Hypholoma sublateritium (strain FD-334 SS-4) TaxID=945553 RepID=A0A0D2MJM5_HYPSF|nr:hypothetical protein HYPSUDRAFT_137230 [Hypholoma sublateritium FD-334 SS-4]
MSFLVGPISGALVAGGVYYGFSNLMQTRTEQHIKDMHALSVRLVETPTLVQAPPSAATRIRPHPLATEIKSKWNDEVAGLFLGFQNLDKRAVEWGRSLLYGPPDDEVKATTSSPSSSS